MLANQAGDDHMNEMTQRARPESGGPCHCTALRKALRRISQLYDTALAPSGLKTTQRAILAEIERSEPTTVGSLAGALVMDAGGLAHTLKPLTREKLVTIAVDPQDRRNRLISLTPLGRSKLRESDALWEAAQRSFEAAFGAAETEDLREAMQFLVANDFTETFETALASTGR
jgi:DNA-binding MarR family transcriptional regulator